MPLNSKDSYSRVAYFWVQHLNVTFLAKKDPKKVSKFSHLKTLTASLSNVLLKKNQPQL